MKRIGKLVLVLIMTFFCSTALFACDKDIKVKVVEILFSDSVNGSIDMIVGEEYTPEIIFTPTFASNRQYRLTCTDTNVLKIEGTKIIALSSGSTNLVATSKSESKKATIQVFVYTQPIRLEVPENLTFDGSKITYNAVTDADNYQLKINGREYAPLGNVTSYNKFATNGLHYDEIQTVAVRAYADGTTALSSNYSAPIKFVCISQVKNVAIDENQVLTFDAIENVEKYEITIQTGIAPSLTTNVYETTSNSVDLKSAVYNTSGAGTYSVFVKGLKKDYNLDALDDAYITLNNIFNGANSETIKFQKLATPTNFVLNNNTLSWTALSLNCSYSLRITNQDASVFNRTYEGITTSTFAIPAEVPAGNYLAQLTATKADNDNGATYSSQITNAVSFEKLATPTLTILNNTISWTANDKASGYNLYVNGTATYISGTSFSIDASTFNAGEYSFAVQACGDTSSRVSSNYLAEADWLTVTKLAIPTLYPIANLRLSWDAVENTSGYDVYLGTTKLNDSLIPSGTLFFDLLPSLFEGGNEYELTVQAIGNGTSYFNSNASSRSVVEKLSTVNSIAITNGVLGYTQVYGASSYKVQYFDNSDHLLEATTLDELPAGNYIVKVTAMGNGAEILDAESSFAYSFSRLATPTFEKNGQSVNWNEVETASKYSLFVKPFEGTEREIFNLTETTYTFGTAYSAGVYGLSIIAKGNGSNILDSFKTAEEDIYNIKKLATAITANYSFVASSYTLNINIESNIDSDVTEYAINFYIPSSTDADVKISTSNSYTFVASDFANAGEYSINTIVKAKDIDADGNNLLDSDKSQDFIVTKLAQIENLRVDDNKLKFNQKLTYASYYNATLKIDSTVDSNELIAIDGNFAYDFETDEFNLFENAGTYLVNAKLEGNGAEILDGEYFETAHTITKLPETINFVQNGDKLSFDAIANCDYYYLNITNGENIQKLQLESIEAVSGKIVVDIYTTRIYGTTKILSDYIAIGENTLSIICKGDYVSSSIDSNASAEIIVTRLSAPTIEMNTGIITISDAENAINYQAIINYANSEGPQIKRIDVANEDGTQTIDVSSYLDIDSIASISVKAEGISTTFTSVYSNIIKYKRMARPTLSVKDGLLVWNGISTQTFELTIDATTIIGDLRGTDSYDFATLGGMSNTTFYPTIKEIATSYLDSPNTQGFYNIDSLLSTPLEVIKLSPVVNFVQTGDKFSFNATLNCSLYTLYIKSIATERIQILKLENIMEQDGKINIDVYATKTEENKIIADYLDAGSYEMQIVSRGNDSNSINSDKGSVFNLNRLFAPTISMDRGIVAIAETENTAEFYVKIEYINSENVTDYYFETISNNEIDTFDVNTLPIDGTAKISIKSLGDNSKISSVYSNSIAYLRLQKPTMSVEDGVLKWSSVDNLTTQFDLAINGIHYTKEATESFDFYGLGGATNTTLNPQIKAIAINNLDSQNAVDGVCYIDSLYTAKEVVKLATPSLSIDNGLFKYTTLIGATNYIVDFISQNTTIDSYVSYNLDANIGGEDQFFEKIDILSRAGGQLTSASIRAYNKTADSNIIYSDVFTLSNINMLSTPTNVRFENECIMFDAVANSTKYKIEIINKDSSTGIENNRQFFETTSTQFAIPLSWGVGLYEIKIQVIGGTSPNNYINSKWSSVYVAEKLRQIENFNTTNGIFCWEGVSRALKYQVTIYEFELSFSSFTVIAHQIGEVRLQTATTFSFPSIYEGVYGISVKAIGNSTTILSGQESRIVTTYVLDKTESTSVYLEDGKLHFSMNPYSDTVTIVLTNTQNFARYAFKYQNIVSRTPNINFFGESDHVITSSGSYSRFNLAPTHIECELKDVLKVPAGNYNITITTNGNSNIAGGDITTCENINQIMSTMSIGICLLNSQNLTISDDALTANDNNGFSTYYKLPTPIITNPTKGVMSWTIDGEKYVTDSVEPRFLINLSKGESNFSFETNVYSINFNNDELLDEIGNHYIDKISGEQINLSFTGGQYVLNIQFLMTDDDTVDKKYINSEISDDSTMLILDTPQLEQSEGVLHWGNIIWADNFKLTIKNLASQAIADASVELLTSTTYEYELSDDYSAGQYWINLKAMTPENRNDMIDSKGNEFFAKYKYDISNINFTFVNGIAKWMMPTSVSGVAEGIVCGTYEVTIDSDVYRFNVYDENGQYSKEGIQINPGVNPNEVYLCYELPEKAQRLNGTWFEITSGNHIITIKAIGDDKQSLCSATSSAVTFIKHDKIQNIHLENGILAWKTIRLPISAYRVRVSFTELNEDNEYINYNYFVDITQTADTYATYTLPTEIIIDSTRHYLNGNKDYTFNIQALGITNGSINYANSNRSEDCKYSRIKNLTGISTQDGIMKWDASIGTSYYIIDYTNATGNYIIQVKGFISEFSLFNEDENLLDNSIYTILTLNGHRYNKAIDGNPDFKTGSFTVKVKALGTTTSVGQEGYLNSIESSAYSFEKLTAPTCLVAENIESQTVISWQPVTNADRYEVEIKQYQEDGMTLINSIDTTDDDNFADTKYILTNALSDKTIFKIRVRAFTTTNLKINSEYSSKLEITSPDAVNRETFKLDQINNRFEWEAVEGVTEYSVKYKFEQAISADEGIYLAAEVINKTLTFTEPVTIGGKKYYYYYLEDIGVYSEVLVVSISGGITSMETSWTADNMDNYTFDKFDAGAGTEENNYLIQTTAQFANIKQYPSKHFKQIVNLDFEEEPQISLFATTEAKFGGVYDGDEYSISNYFNNTSDELNKGIFGYISGGKIKDLIINNAKMSIYESSANGQILQGMLASEVENGTFENINIIDGIIRVKANSNTDGVMVGGIAGNLINSSVKNCEVRINIAIEVTIASGSPIYAGGVAGKCLTSVINNNIINLTYGIPSEEDAMTGQRNSSRKTIVGGAVAYMTSGTIDLMSAVVNINDINIGGGLVGENFEGKITRAFSSGLITTSAQINASKFDGLHACIGGLVGKANTLSKINNSHTTMNLTIDNGISGTVTKAGLLCGQNFGTISNCYVYADSKNIEGTIINYGRVDVSSTNEASGGQATIYAFVGEMAAGTTLLNCYYNTITCYYAGVSTIMAGTSSGGGISKTKSYMQSSNFVEELNTNAGSTIYIQDIEWIPRLIGLGA